MEGKRERFCLRSSTFQPGNQSTHNQAKFLPMSGLWQLRQLAQETRSRSFMSHRRICRYLEKMTGAPRENQVPKVTVKCHLAFFLYLEYNFLPPSFPPFFPSLSLFVSNPSFLPPPITPFLAAFLSFFFLFIHRLAICQQLFIELLLITWCYSRHWIIEVQMKLLWSFILLRDLPLLDITF